MVRDNNSCQVIDKGPVKKTSKKTGEMLTTSVGSLHYKNNTAETTECR